MKHILILIACLCPMFLFGQNTLSTLENMYTVSKGETWESVADKYSISVSELKAANPDVTRKKLKKRTLLIIPQSATLTHSQSETISHSPSEEMEKGVPLIRTSMPDLKVGVLLPFADVKMVEFYRGLLMAADSVRLSGVNLDIHAWDCGSSMMQVEQLLPKLNGLDILFGPTSSTQTLPVAELCREQGTRLVLPFLNEPMLQEYPLVYYATVSKPAVYEFAAEKLVSYYADKNFVIVRCGNATNDGKILCETLTQKLAQKNLVPRTLELEGDDFAYESSFNQFRGNVILLDDSRVRSLNILLARLKDFRQKHSDYHLSLVGYPEWQDETQRLLSEFFVFDTYIISSYYYNVLDDRTKHFQHTYEKFFRTPIANDNPRYAAFGYDLGYYFLRGISSLGDTFEQMQGSLQQQPFQHRFQFERGATNMSFSNHFLQFIHFTTNNMIELVR